MSDAETNHRGKTPRDVISDACPGTLSMAYETADLILAALTEAGFMVVTQEYVG